MKKVISFSIYGQYQKYTVGLLKNLQLAKEIYPNWMVYVYYNNTVPVDMIEKYKEFDNVELINMNNSNIPGMFWRFIPREGVEIFISRDADSRLMLREKLAVDEWIKVDKTLHILRDHPHHEHEMMGGLFGLKITDKFNMLEEIEKWLIGKNLTFDNKFGDLDFLDNVVFPFFKNDLIAHDSVWTNRPGSTPFPTPMENYRFVGEVLDENDIRYPQYREWINRKEIGYE
jgi:hypothetical protein